MVKFECRNYFLKLSGIDNVVEIIGSDVFVGEEI